MNTAESLILIDSYLKVYLIYVKMILNLVNGFWL